MGGNELVTIIVEITDTDIYLPIQGYNIAQFFYVLRYYIVNMYLIYTFREGRARM